MVQADLDVVRWGTVIGRGSGGGSDTVKSGTLRPGTIADYKSAINTF